MVRRRVRIRFAKQADLRLISHRDLLRTWQRLLRRADVPMSMSEGFHPKPRMNFPSALAVGIAGLDEVLELEIAEELSADDLRGRIVSQAPEGLIIHHIEVMPPECRKAMVRRVTFETGVPIERQSAVANRIEWLLAQDSCLIERELRSLPIDLRPLVDEISLRDGTLHMRLRVDPQGSARPREVLEVLQIADLESQGYSLTRSQVELED